MDWISLVAVILTGVGMWFGGHWIGAIRKINKVMDSLIEAYEDGVITEEELKKIVAILQE